MYGLVFGSFCVTLGIRIAAQRPLFRGASRCDHCHTRLVWFELLPVLSWCLLRGRCRTCGHAIPALYPLYEGGAGVLAVLIFRSTGFSSETLVLWCGLGMLCALSAADSLTLRLPDKILWPAIWTIAALRLFIHPLGMWSYGAGAVIGYGALYAVYVLSRGGLGFGDVKLFTLVGLLVGLPLLGFAIGLASLIGLISAIVRRASMRTPLVRPLPFGPPIALSTLLTALYGQGWLQFYLHTFFSASPV
ncbi:MAG: A24 family peptidase [Firmicutes bacterium]|nr:A24 family peptidase [Bacillota bacterium]